MSADSLPLVYVSYAWRSRIPAGLEAELNPADDREAIVDELCQVLDQEDGLEVGRDKKRVKNGDSIVEFAREIARGGLILAVVSHKSLRSDWCMVHELLQAFRRRNFNLEEFGSDVLALVLEDALGDISNPLELVKHWKARLEQEQELMMLADPGRTGSPVSWNLVDQLVELPGKLPDLLHALRVHVMPRGEEAIREQGFHAIRKLVRQRLQEKGHRPVPAEPLVVRHPPRLAGEPLRLLCFVVPELQSWSPSDSRGRGPQRYRLGFWIARGDGQPKGLHNLADADKKDLDEAAKRLREALKVPIARDQLAATISAVYLYQANEEPPDDGHLLLNLFLPLSMLVATDLPAFLADLHRHAREQDPICDGLPLLLACASRWPVGAECHPLQNSRRWLLTASGRLVKSLFCSEQQPPNPLATLDWLRVESQPAPASDPQPACHARLRPFSRFRVVTAGEVVQPQEGAPDPRVERDAAYLADGARLAEPHADLALAIKRLVEGGIPLIWRAGPEALACVEQRGAGAGDGHPMDEILAWNGLSFLGFFHRYCTQKQGERDEPHLALRQFVRHSILFWEDHRHIPSVTPMTPHVPFHPHSA